MTDYLERTVIDPTRMTGATPHVSSFEPALTIPIAVLEADPGVRGRLAMQVGERAVPLESVEQLDESLLGSPLVVVLGPSCAGPQGLASAADGPLKSALLALGRNVLKRNRPA